MSAKPDKLDAGKDEWYLMPFEALRLILRVFMFGAKKYAPHGWQTVPDAKRRYFDALMRHLTAWWGGEKNDPETGLSHLGHAGCCILILTWHELQAERVELRSVPAESLPAEPASSGQIHTRGFPCHLDCPICRSC